MKLHTLKPAEGSIKSGKRIARGQGSGRGGTSTRGHKGAQSRSCLLYTSPSPRDLSTSRMPSSA